MLPHANNHQTSPPPVEPTPPPDYGWPLPPDLCPIWIYLDVLLSTASIMHLCTISLDRYMGIRNPMHHSRFTSHTRARIKILAVWTISAGEGVHGGGEKTGAESIDFENRTAVFRPVPR